MSSAAFCETKGLSKKRVTRRAFYLFLNLLAASTAPFLVPSVQSAQPSPQQPQIVVDSDDKYLALTEGQRVRILVQMIHAGRATLADRLLNTYPFKGKHARNRTLFIEGMILKVNGDQKAAIANFRSALADDPNLSLVRMELAHSLYSTKQDDGAKHHLTLLRDSAPSVDTSKQFDRFIDAVDARNPWSLDAYFSLAPSTNFNNGSSEEIIFIDGLPFRLSANSVEKSGIGFRGGVNGSYTLRAGKDLDFIAGAGLNFTEYDGNVFDDQIVSQSLSVQQRSERGTFTAGIHAYQRWSGTDEFSWSIGPQISMRMRLAPKLGLFSKLRHSIIDYKQTDYRSGHKLSADHRLSYSFSDGTIGYLIAGGERSISELDYNDYWAASGGVGIYHEAPYGITIYAEAEVRRQVHDGRYPVINEARKDTRVEIDVSLAKRDFEVFGLTPRVHYSYIKNMSNSLFDDYETHGANLTLTRQF